MRSGVRRGDFLPLKDRVLTPHAGGGERVPPRIGCADFMHQWNKWQLAQSGAARMLCPGVRGKRRCCDDRRISPCDRFRLVLRFPPKLLNIMSTTYHVMPGEVHDRIVAAAFRHRGYTRMRRQPGRGFRSMASLHGIRTHNAIKALHLDEHFGSKAGGCKPGAAIEKLPGKYKAVQRWNANRSWGWPSRLRRWMRA